MKATIYKTDGQKVEYEPKNGRYFTLREMQRAVGGFIEFVYHKDLILVCNEEGLLQDLPLNVPIHNEFGYTLVGDILVTPKKYIR